jgi:predicted Zn finger-like uncharacterized protein
LFNHNNSRWIAPVRRIETMIVACPACHARFRLDERRLSRTRSLLRCSRCQHTFPAPARPSAPERPAATTEGETLRFAFDDDDDWTDDPLEESAGEEPFLVPHSEKRKRRGARRAGAEVEVEDAFAAEETLPALRIEDDEDDGGENGDDREERRGATLSLKPFFVFLLLVVTGYAVFARTLYANPRWTAELTGELPMIGGDPIERSPERKVALIELAGRHERTKDGGLVFVITGKAVNQSDSRLQSVQIAATLFDGDGNPIGREVIFCGNTVRTDLIRNLTVSQVTILAGLKPPHYFSVQPAATCPFVSIFTDVPAALASFSVEITAVQRHG